MARGLLGMGKEKRARAGPRQVGRRESNPYCVGDCRYPSAPQVVRCNIKLQTAIKAVCVFIVQIVRAALPCSDTRSYKQVS